MNIIKVPEATRHQPQIGADDIIFVDYKDQGSFSRHSVFFDRYAFSFVQNGQKHIYRAQANTVLSKGYGMLVPEGNSLITEHSNNAEQYHSVIVFFPGSIGREFIADKGLAQFDELHETPFIHFQTNAYIQEYIRNIRSLINQGQQLSKGMSVLKVKELLTAMFELAPGLLFAVFRPQGNVLLKTLVENNLLNPMTIDELAFLSNRSLSSFKRDFQREYGLPPQKYIREKRLEMACAELSSGKSATELYITYGYTQLSNFTAAFKRKYGLSPINYTKSRIFERSA